MYDEAAQPNYNSQDLDVKVAEDHMMNGYDSIKCMIKPRREVTNPIPKNESIENDYDTAQHTMRWSLLTRNPRIKVTIETSVRQLPKRRQPSPSQ